MLEETQLQVSACPWSGTNVDIMKKQHEYGVRENIDKLKGVPDDHVLGSWTLNRATQQL
jgi:hypothetical protein